MWVKDQIERTAKDLLNLEINTIIDPDLKILGTKMPEARHALIDIGKDYQRELTRRGVDGAQLPFNLERRFGSFAAFHHFRETAKQEIEKLTKEQRLDSSKGQQRHEEPDIYMLLRIKDMSDQLKAVFQKLEQDKVENWDNLLTREEIQDPNRKIRPLPLDVNQLALIRKAWELGVREIAMQTVIQLDGDVVTRVQPARKADGDLLKIHSKGVSTSVDFWKELIQIAKDLLASLIRLASLGRDRRP